MTGEERTEAAEGAAVADPTTWPPPKDRVAPDGCVLVWQPESRDRGLAWTTEPHGADRCRYTVGPGHLTCGRPAVAWLNRASSASGKPSWWAYCGRHLYGRRISNGQVWHCVAMAVSDA